MKSFPWDIWQDDYWMLDFPMDIVMTCDLPELAPRAILAPFEETGLTFGAMLLGMKEAADLLAFIETIGLEMAVFMTICSVKRQDWSWCCMTEIKILISLLIITY